MSKYNDTDKSGIYFHVASVVAELTLFVLDYRSGYNARKFFKPLIVIEHLLDGTVSEYLRHPRIMEENKVRAALLRMETWAPEHRRLIPWIICDYLDTLYDVMETEKAEGFLNADRSVRPEMISNMEEHLQMYFKKPAAARVIQSNFKLFMKKLAAARIIQAYYRHWTLIPDSRPCKRRMIEAAKEYGMKP